MSKISVVIPVYNVEQYIPKTLESLINQTHKPYEIIIVNDGSTDNTVNVSEKILKNSNIQYKIINQINQGVSVARNRGIESASGDYIHFIDGDDWVHPQFFETLLNNIQNSQKEIDVASTSYAIVYEDIPNKKSIRTTRYIKENIALSYLKFVRSPYAFIHIGSLIFRREFLIKNKIFFLPGVKITEDGGFLFKSLLLSQNTILIDKPLFYYLVRNNSSDHSKEQYMQYTSPTTYIMIQRNDLMHFIIW